MSWVYLSSSNDLSREKLRWTGYDLIDAKEVERRGRQPGKIGSD